MKRLMITLINLYQSLPLSSHKACKYVPTCSEYSKEAYTKYGFFKGSYLTIKRILRCVPWKKGGYDPVPNLGGNYEKN